MENKDLFMVNTSNIELIGYFSDLAYAIGKRKKCFVEEEDLLFGMQETDIAPLEIAIPFKKTSNSNREQFVEMLTGTLYYREGNMFFTEDSSACFGVGAIEEYTDEKLGDLYDENPMFIVKQKIKFAYILNRIRNKKENEISSEKGAKILSKLQKKHKNKLEDNK